LFGLLEFQQLLLADIRKKKVASIFQTYLLSHEPEEGSWLTWAQWLFGQCWTIARKFYSVKQLVNTTTHFKLPLLVKIITSFEGKAAVPRIKVIIAKSITALFFSHNSYSNFAVLS